MMVILVLVSHEVLSDSLPPHWLQQTRLPCPSLSPGVCSNSCPLSQWCHLILHRHSRLLLSMSWLFSWGDQSIEASVSAPILPVNIQGWFPLELTRMISLQSNRLWSVFSSIMVEKHQFFSTQPSLLPSSHIRTWILEKPKLWLDRSLSAKPGFLIRCLGLS